LINKNVNVIALGIRAVRMGFSLLTVFNVYFVLMVSAVVGCWHGYLSGARCRFAYGPVDATATHYLLLQ